MYSYVDFVSVVSVSLSIKTELFSFPRIQRLLQHLPFFTEVTVLPTPSPDFPGLTLPGNPLRDRRRGVYLFTKKELSKGQSSCRRSGRKYKYRDGRSTSCRLLESDWLPYPSMVRFRWTGSREPVRPPVFSGASRDRTLVVRRHRTSENQWKK